MKITRKVLIQRLDKLRQTYARYDGAKKRKGEWVNSCVTCGRVLPCDKQNGGHFILRGCIPLRWDKKNVNCQCPACNLYKNGAYLEYSQWFIKQYGEEEFNRYVDMYREWRQGKIRAYRMDELRQIYDHWLKEGRELEKKVGKDLFPKSWDSFGPEFIENI